MTTKLCDCNHCRGQCQCTIGLGWSPHCSGSKPIGGAEKRPAPAALCDGIRGSNFYWVGARRCAEPAVGHLAGPDGKLRAARRYCTDCGRKAAEEANREGLAGKPWTFEAEQEGAAASA